MVVARAIRGISPGRTLRGKRLQYWKVNGVEYHGAFQSTLFPCFDKVCSSDLGDCRTLRHSGYFSVIDNILGHLGQVTIPLIIKSDSRISI